MQGIRGFKNISSQPLNVCWLVVSTDLKNLSQLGSFPQVAVKITNVWNHHLVWYDLPGDSHWPFLSPRWRWRFQPFQKVTFSLTIPKRSPAELPRTYIYNRNEPNVCKYIPYAPCKQIFTYMKTINFSQTNRKNVGKYSSPSRLDLGTSPNKAFGLDCGRDVTGNFPTKINLTPKRGLP